MFLNLDGFGKCSSVSRIPRLPAFGSSERQKKEVRIGEIKNAIKSDHFVLPARPNGSVGALLGPIMTKRGQEAAKAAATVCAKAEEEHFDDFNKVCLKMTILSWITTA